MTRNRKETVELSVWDPAEDFRDEEEMALYLLECLKTGDTSLLLAAIGDVIRAKEMAAASKKTKVGARSPRVSPRKRAVAAPKSSRRAVAVAR